MKNKAKLLAKGYNQEKNIDYHETSAPIARMEANNIMKNKAKLLEKEYNQEKGIDSDEIYAPITRLEAIRILLAFAFLKGFKLF